MYKKGSVTFEEILKWALGFLVLFIIISIIVGPDELLAKTRDAVFSFGLEFSPEEKALPISAEVRIPIEIEKYFDNLVFKIKNSQSGEQCRIDIGEIPKVEGFNIVLDANKIQIKKIDQRGLTPSEKVENIDEFNPCSVKGAKTGRFYRCFKEPDKYNPDWCKNVYEDSSIVLNENTKITKFLFKPDSSHFCAIYLDGNDLIPGCNEVKDLVDDACAEDIKNTYVDCSISSPPKKQFDKECDAINYCYSELEIIKAYPPNSGCDFSRPVALFYSKEDCIKSSKCIKEHTKKITFKDCDDSNKQISLSGGFVWVWPEYS